MMARSASCIARARTAPTTDACSGGTRPRLSCVSRYSAPLASRNAASAARAPSAPRPVSTSGRRACSISAAARSTSAGVGRNAPRRLAPRDTRAARPVAAPSGAARRSGSRRRRAPADCRRRARWTHALSRSRSRLSATRSVRALRVTGFMHADVIDALQRTEIVLRHRRAAADQQHRHALELRIGHRRHAVGHAGAGGHHRDAQAAGTAPHARAPCARQRPRRARR